MIFWFISLNGQNAFYRLLRYNIRPLKLVVFMLPGMHPISPRFPTIISRDDVKTFTDLLYENHIPLLIFSAGLGDVIRLLLQRFSMDTDNVRVVSNFMRFNDEVSLS